MTRRALCIALVLALTGCATAQDGVQRYAGVYTEGFETMSFAATGSRERWWVSFDRDSFDAIERVAPPQSENSRAGFRLDVVFEGRVSAEGRYGHLGGYKRELHVTRVISASRQPSGS